MNKHNIIIEYPRGSMQIDPYAFFNARNLNEIKLFYKIVITKCYDKERVIAQCIEALDEELYYAETKMADKTKMTEKQIKDYIKKRKRIKEILMKGK